MSGTLRRPRTEAEQYDWHRRTLEHIALHGEKDRNRPPMHDGDPQAGWYRRRLVPKGPWVPARIWILPSVTDVETGQVMVPEKMLCEVDGRMVDVFRAWTWLGQNPITEDQFMDMKAAGFRDLAPGDAPDLDVLRDEPVIGMKVGPETYSPLDKAAGINGPVKVVDDEPRPEPGPGKPLF